MSDIAIVLLSGGADSATALAIAQKQGFDCYCLSFDYGQRHVRELEAAQRIAAAFGIENKKHKTIHLDLRSFGGSALTDEIDVPKHSDVAHLASKHIPITYVPARNTIFLSYALAYAEVLSANAIFIGCNVIDYSHYPDCGHEYLEAFEVMANIASARGQKAIRIQAPLLHLDKSQIISEGIRLGVDYSMTMSCYDPDDNGRACGGCDACLLRREGFEKLGLEDPALNASRACLI